MRKIVAALLCAALLLTLPVAVFADDTPAAPEGIWTDYAAVGFAGGTGTAEDPYKIATAEQLALLAKGTNSGNPELKYNNCYFVLTANIDLSAHRWIPIGRGTETQSFQSFDGYFNGAGHSITGLYVDESAEQFSAGLFGNFGGHVLENLTVDGYVKTEDPGEQYDGAGILIGCATPGHDTTITVRNCHVTGRVESDSAAGGLVGKNSYGVYENCTANVRVNGAGCAGGFIGSCFRGRLVNCTASGRVEGAYGVGGFAGVVYYECSVEKCLSETEVIASDWNAGGFVGYVEESCKIRNCVALGDVTSTLNYNDIHTGSFAGSLYGSEISNSHAAGTVYPTLTAGNVGGFIGLNDGTIADSSFSAEKNPELPKVGNPDSTGTEGISAVKTQEVFANICVDYYGGHDLDTSAYVTDVEPTCTEPGQKSYHCKRCGSPDSPVVIDAPGHDYGELIARVEPTTTKTGMAAHYECARCHKLFDEQKAERTEEELTIPRKDGQDGQGGGTIDRSPDITTIGKDGHTSSWLGGKNDPNPPTGMAGHRSVLSVMVLAAALVGAAALTAGKR